MDVDQEQARKPYHGRETVGGESGGTVWSLLQDPWLLVGEPEWPNHLTLAPL